MASRTQAKAATVALKSTNPTPREGQHTHMVRTTESALRDWDLGQPRAERMCADILAVEGFTAIDPQHPLGGPDGRKDVLCQRGYTSFVVAAYFPTTQSTFTEITNKFKGDLEGVAINDAQGFVFFTNQRISVGERVALQELAEGEAHPTEIYNRERLRAVLDSPAGCGIRMEYLSLPMTEEEQVAFWSSANFRVTDKLARIEALQLATLQRIAVGDERILMRTVSDIADLRRDLSSTFSNLPDARPGFSDGLATGGISTSTLLWVHRLVMAGSQSPPTLIGTLRTLDVQVRTPNGGIMYAPPQAEEVPSRLAEWCDSWRGEYQSLMVGDTEAKLFGVAAAYHGLLAIHPFMDGNGRVARAVLDQMLRELFDRQLPEDFNDSRIQLQGALRAADGGDYEPLRKLIAAAISL